MPAERNPGRDCLGDDAQWESDDNEDNGDEIFARIGGGDGEDRGETAAVEEDEEDASLLEEK